MVKKAMRAPIETVVTGIPNTSPSNSDRDEKFQIGALKHEVRPLLNRCLEKDPRRRCATSAMR